MKRHSTLFLAGFRTVRILVPFCLGVLLILAACKPAPAPLPTQTPVIPTPSPLTVTPTEAVPPTPSPAPGSVLLFAPPSIHSLEASQFSTALTDLSAPSGWTVKTVAQLEASDITPEVRVIVCLSVPPNLPDLLATAPHAQWLVVSDVDLNLGSNLSVIRTHPEYQAFLAGFITEILSTDWRGAGLIPSDGALGTGLQDAFVNGGHYFCGVCAPGWPLREYYPQAPTLPAASDGAAWQSAAADLFDNKKADAFFVTSEAAQPEVWSYLSGKNQFETLVRVVGTEPPPEELKAQWAATVRFDLTGPLQKLWPDISNGKGGLSLDADLMLEDVNDDNLGAGKQRLVRELMQEIAAGRINPFTVPVQ